MFIITSYHFGMGVSVGEVNSFYRRQMATYSEQELADKARLIGLLGLTDERRTQLKTDFLNPEFHGCSLSFWATPPKRCSDGVRRRFMEYVDFLFLDVPFEDRIDAENAGTNPYTISATFTQNGDCLDIQMSRR